LKPCPNENTTVHKLKDSVPARASNWTYFTHAVRTK
jgi:hypothetical protein